MPRVEGLPGKSLPPLDLDARASSLSARLGRPVERAEAISHALYPRVLDDFFEARARYEDVSILDTPTYFYGLEVGQERWVDLEPGKTLVLSLEAVSDPSPEGQRTVFFELNGHGRQVTVKDKSLSSQVAERRTADKGNPSHIGASMPGVVIGVACAVGAKVAAGAPLLTLEAMKMETVVRAHKAGTVKELPVALKAKVQAGDLLAVLD
jgi:pyruvate carboxylase